MKKKVKIILIVLISIFMLISCSDRGSLNSDTNEQAVIDIGVLIYRYDDAFITTVRDEMQSYIGKISEDRNIGINVSFLDANNQQEVQFDQLETFINQNVDVLCVNIVNRENAAEMIDAAKKADIPIVFFNREPITIDMMRWDKVYYVGCDAGESGRLQGEMVADYWNENPDTDKNNDSIMQCVFLNGEPNHQDTLQRTENNLQAFEKIGLEIEILASYTANWQREEAENQIDSCLNAFGEEVEVIISNNDEMALGAIEAIKNHAEFDSDQIIPVFGIDATPYAIESLNKNELKGTVLNDGVSQARGVVDIAIALVMDEYSEALNHLEKGRYYWVPYKKISKEDIS